MTHRKPDQKLSELISPARRLTGKAIIKNNSLQVPLFKSDQRSEEDEMEKLVQMSVMIDDSDGDNATEIDQHQSVLDDSVFGGYTRPPVDKDDINK